MSRLFNPDGGELDNKSNFTAIWQIPVIIATVADIFSSLLEVKPKDREYSYCISFDPEYKDTVTHMIYDIMKKGLPDKIRFYEHSGQFLFDMRGASGGIVNSLCLYIITSSGVVK